MQAISYGNVYVARVAFGANPQQTLLAMREAEAYDGPSLILAYSHCIAHGYDLKEWTGSAKQSSGKWSLAIDAVQPCTEKEKSKSICTGFTKANNITERLCLQ